jgi:hypothetical protein
MIGTNQNIGIKLNHNANGDLCFDVRVDWGGTLAVYRQVAVTDPTTDVHSLMREVAEDRTAVTDVEEDAGCIEPRDADGRLSVVAVWHTLNFDVQGSPCVELMTAEGENIDVDDPRSIEMTPESGGAVA